MLVRVTLQAPAERAYLSDRALRDDDIPEIPTRPVADEQADRPAPSRETQIFDCQRLDAIH